MQDFDTFLFDGATKLLAKTKTLTIEKKEDLPKIKSGYYAIYLNGEFIYDGVTTTSVYGRLTAHLFRSRKYDASSAMAIDTIPSNVFDRLVEDKVIRVEDKNYYKQTPDGKARYLNGINIEQWPDDKFEVKIIETAYPDVLKTTNRKINGVPTGAQYKTR